MKDREKSRGQNVAEVTSPPTMPPIKELPQRPQTPEELLLRDVFDKYSADARAGIDSRETVDVDIQYTLLRIQGLVSLVLWRQMCVISCARFIMPMEWTELCYWGIPSDNKGYGSLVSIDVDVEYAYVASCTMHIQ